MNLALSQLAAHLAQSLRPLYVVVGDEVLLAQEALDQIRAVARSAGFTERQSFTVQGAHFDWSEVQAACGAMSLFADKQIIDIHLPTGKPGKDGSAVIQHLAELQSQDEGTVLLINLPRLDKATRQTGWYAALEQYGVCIAVDALERKALGPWIAQRMALHQQRLSGGPAGAQALQFFVDRVEGNLLAAHQEIQKLALLYPPGEISQEQLERAVMDVARYDVFTLGQAIWAGQVSRVCKMLDGLQAEGVAAVLVHFTVADDVRQMLRVKAETAKGKPLPMALREQRVWGVKEKQFEAVVPRVSLAQLQQWVQDAHTLDGVVKGLKSPQWPTDPWLALMRWTTQLAQAAQPVKPAQSLATR